MANPFIENKRYFDRPISEFVFFDKYSRFNWYKGRRETWAESVERAVDFLTELSNHALSEEDYEDIYNGILSMGVAPSMRLMATAGKAAHRNHVAVFNCAYTPIQSLEAIAELLWLSMSGVGVGYSVENRYVSQIQKIHKQDDSFPLYHAIEDTTEGWVNALSIGLHQWMNGKDVQFDYSQIRPAGAILKTKGGRASGPDVLVDLLDFTRKIILGRQGEQLRSIDVFDICTRLGWAAVSGGSRRSAQLVMFDIDDQEMMQAKSGRFWEHSPHRVNANISAVWERHLTREEIKKYMQAVFDSGTGEPGIVSRLAMNATRPAWRREITDGGVNACSEINLQGSTADGRYGGEFCNLSTVQVYPEDTEETLLEKVRLATIVGTIQSMATNFKMLRPTWKEIYEEERLLGVCLIGTMDNELSRDPALQRRLRDHARQINIEYAMKLGINPSAAITAVKPSGNSSVLYNVARGINARYAPYYIRRVRTNAYTPMYRVLKESGVPLSPENGQSEETANTFVATFYEKSPDGAITISDVTALDQLDYWKQVKENWCHHNASVTVEYTPDEEEAIIDWVYENQAILNGVSFLPRTEHFYEQAPYEEITKEEYEQAIADFPSIDFSLLEVYEREDFTVREAECSAGVCDLF